MTRRRQKKRLKNPISKKIMNTTMMRITEMRSLMKKKNRSIWQKKSKGLSYSIRLLKNFKKIPGTPKILAWSSKYHKKMRKNSRHQGTLKLFQLLLKLKSPTILFCNKFASFLFRERSILGNF
jgi:hypothetical protein